MLFASSGITEKKMQMKKRFLIIMILLNSLGLLDISAIGLRQGKVEESLQPSEQTLATRSSVYFYLGADRVEPGYMQNDSVLRVLIDDLKKVLTPDSRYRADSIVITGSASPLGGETLNRALSRRRADSLKLYLCGQVAIPDSLLTVRSVGANWDDLRAMVEKSQMKYRKEVLRVINEVPVNKRRNYVLMDLKWGRPYREMMETFFPQLQNAATVIVYTTYIPKVAIEPIQPEIKFHPAGPVPDEIAPQPVVVQPRGSEEKQPLLNLSTNLLYWGALAPNIGVEYCMPQGHWSINAEFVQPWWKKPAEHKYYQIRQFSGEPRYWLNGDGYYRGHFFGAYGNGGIYDLENGGTGYKGSFWGTGITYGYVWKLRPRFRLEFSLGVGYLSTKYEQYEPIDNCYVYEKTVRKGYVGPTKAKVGLVWTIIQRNKQRRK